jgi:hypothetical protein
MPFHNIHIQTGASLDEKARLFDAQYPEALERKTKIDESSSKKEKQYRRAFVEHLGKQLKRADIP